MITIIQFAYYWSNSPVLLKNVGNVGGWGGVVLIVVDKTPDDDRDEDEDEDEVGRRWGFIILV